MKGTRTYPDLGTIFDEIFEAAQDFKDELHRNFDRCGSEFCGRERGPFGRGGPFGKNFFDENTDFYPGYYYPPMNVFMTSDRTLIFEFALAGFDEKDISLSFQGDYMVFSAVMPRNAGEPVKAGEADADGSEDRGSPEAENVSSDLRYFKRRLKLKDIEKQKYFVPLDKYAQDKVKAVYRNGILRVSVPPKDEPDQIDGVRIEIIKEGV
ncbi:MAG: Hsp20 family protein [Treponema sp.]|jgi:HSP20 family molecular chaperone IbpA|nr:Hsp20 family protein [Treponema sp.]